MISGSMFGTDFSYEDFERLQGVGGESETKRLPDEEIDGRHYYVLREIPEDDDGYESITNWIDKETCVPHRTEFREEGDELRKVALIDPKKVTRQGDKWIPGEMVIRDLLNETFTRLDVEKIEIGGKIPRKMFSERELAKGH